MLLGLCGVARMDGPPARGGRAGGGLDAAFVIVRTPRERPVLPLGRRDTGAAVRSSGKQPVD